MNSYYLFEGEHWIMEYDSGGTNISNVLYGRGVDELISRGVQVNGVNQGWFYFPDRNGNISVVTNGTTEVLESYRYDAFGLPTVTPGAGGAIGNRFLFTGREWNPTFGFYEYRARAYNPKIGRFMSEDPKGFDAGDYNLYRYVSNDPLDKTDPMGLDALFDLVRDAYTEDQNPRRSAGIMFIYENGRYLGAARVNQNGFTTTPYRQGIPAGRYAVLPKAEDGNFKKGTPAVTGLQYQNEPGRATRSHQQGDILIHPKGSKDGEPDSRGCQTVSGSCFGAIKSVMERNLGTTTERVQNGPQISGGVRVERALPVKEIDTEVVFSLGSLIPTRQARGE